MTDQYGNYVIQFVITLDNHNVNLKISEQFISNIVELSKQKFSSNVIEKVELFFYSDSRIFK